MGLGGLRELVMDRECGQRVIPEKGEMVKIILVSCRLYTGEGKYGFISVNIMCFLKRKCDAQCYYQGYIEGYPNSFVTLSTCSGLRGILQFENVSYGIEPLESAVEFQHLLYKLGNEKNEFAVLPENNQDTEQNPMDYNIFISEKPESTVSDLIPLYLEMHIVVDKALFDYLGSDSMIVTNKVIEIIGLVNSMFAQFKVSVVLSSLELWSDKNKISTVGEADELLHRFLEWKKSYLTLRPHDIYPKEITLEAVSVIVTQMLGLSLGISYDNSKKCRCSGAICIMSTKALQSSGMKTFSDCSLRDFGNFISNVGAQCLQNKPQMQRQPASICGNGRVEGNEVCDCGTEEFVQAGATCRPIAHPECDIPEVCNGSSGRCPADITILNGRKCEGGKAFCYDGGCQDIDARCESVFGKGSKNAPFACYEEIQSQTDRFGNCGKEGPRYTFCPWRSLICGRLICTYPLQTPFLRDSASVIYAFVRSTVCITMHYETTGTEDPLVVNNGTICDKERNFSVVSKEAPRVLGQECEGERFPSSDMYILFFHSSIYFFSLGIAVSLLPLPVCSCVPSTLSVRALKMLIMNQLGSDRTQADEAIIINNSLNYTFLNNTYETQKTPDSQSNLEKLKSKSEKNIFYIPRDSQESSPTPHKRLLISWLQSPSAVNLEPQN
ncbi:hypothetical protein FD754_012842 [Muntiacus muntjak]|uniref:Peptidase M12B domain-containing protein n=1 Tax=Muntiacus muntjak TaxID=9888 RepID=A0A5N3VI38_MUNMU|nr:hypothetical protein FD754_012842 [Muntiacus muntjak]